MEVYHWVSNLGYMEGEIFIDRQNNTATMVSRWSTTAKRLGVNYTQQPMADVDLTASQADTLLVRYATRKLNGKDTYKTFERVQ